MPTVRNAGDAIKYHLNLARPSSSDGAVEGADAVPKGDTNDTKIGKGYGVP